MGTWVHLRQESAHDEVPGERSAEMPQKTVAEKARVKPGVKVSILGDDSGVVGSLGLPEDTKFVDADAAELVFLFVRTRVELEAQMPSTVRSLAPGASLWVFFRKGSKNAGLDMNRDSIWSIAEGLNMRPLGIVSVDETWSAFRLRCARAQ